MNKSSRKQANTQLQQNPNSKEAILEAALRTFARYGFDGASLPKIAKVAEVAPPLIHYYFGSKDNLWRETIDHSLGELRREVSAILNATSALSPLDRLRAILQAVTYFAARCPDHFSLIMAEARSDSDRFAWVQDNYTGVLFEDVLSILSEAKDKGLIKNVDLSQSVIMLIGAILTYFTISPPPTGEKDLRQLADEFTEALISMFLNGVST